MNSFVYVYDRGWCTVYKSDAGHPRFWVSFWILKAVLIQMCARIVTIDAHTRCFSYLHRGANVIFPFSSLRLLGTHRRLWQWHCVSENDLISPRIPSRSRVAPHHRLALFRPPTAPPSNTTKVAFQYRASDLFSWSCIRINGQYPHSCTHWIYIWRYFKG